MANPTPATIDWVRSRVSDWSATDAELAEQLNTETVPNPAPAPLVPALTTALPALDVLLPATLDKLEATGLLVVMNKAVGEGRLWEAANWVQYCVRRGHMSPEEATALGRLLDDTQPDPNHPTELPRPLLELGRLVDADDLAVARGSE